MLPLTVLVIDGLLQLGPGGSQAQIHHLELNGPYPPKIIDLRVEGHIHPASREKPQLRPLVGKKDGIQRRAPKLQLQLQMPAPAHLRHGVYLGPLKQKYRAGVSGAAGLQQIQ